MGFSVAFNISKKGKKELSYSLVFMAYYFGFQFMVMETFIIHYLSLKSGSMK